MPTIRKKCSSWEPCWHMDSYIMHGDAQRIFSREDGSSNVSSLPKRLADETAPSVTWANMTALQKKKCSYATLRKYKIKEQQQQQHQGIAVTFWTFPRMIYCVESGWDMLIVHQISTLGSVPRQSEPHSRCFGSRSLVKRCAWFCLLRVCVA